MWYNKYIGIPYKDNGRDESGLDCWGLLRLVYKNEYNIDLPSFSESYVTARDVESTTELLAINRENWKSIETPVVGCGILFRILGQESHVGVYIGGGKFIHAREGHSVTVERLDSVQWRHRIAGFYQYEKSSSPIIASSPHPFKTKVYLDIAEEGTTLETIAKNINSKYNISDKIKRKIVMLLNGRVVPQELWHKTTMSKFDRVEYRAVPQGSNPLRMILMIAVIIIAPQIAAALAPSFGITAAAIQAGSIGFTALKMGVMMVGMALVDAIAPVRPPDTNNPNNPGAPIALNLFSGGGNKSNPWGAVPVVLGRMRMTPPLGAEPFVQMTENTSYLKEALVWGFGPLQLEESSLCVGTTPLVDFLSRDNKVPELVHVDHGPHSSTLSQKQAFNQIYSTDTKQYLPNVELAANSQIGVPGPWYDLTIDNGGKDINKIELVLTFPEGLRRVYTSGDNIGDSDSESATFQYQIVEENSSFPDPGSSILNGSYTLRQNRDVDLPTAILYTTDQYGEGQSISGYVWVRIGMLGDSIRSIQGSFTDSKFSNPSPELQQKLLSGTYKYGAGLTNSSFVRIPEFNDSRVIPLYDVCITGNSGVVNPGTDIVSYISSEPHTGLNISIEIREDNDGGGEYNY